MNSIDLLEDIKKNEGIEKAIDKYKHMLFSLHLIERDLLNGNSTHSTMTLEECQIKLNNMIKWKITNRKAFYEQH
jgi:hypothetical protein